jgi:DNA-binding response OmpR family regulator
MPTDDHNRILIVDDHGDTGRALKCLLRRRGYEAEYVTSGQEAVEAIRRGDVPRMVILDVMMPDMSGIQTLVEMKKSVQFDNTPVVMYSASEDPATMQQAYRLGARDYILKGSDWDEMIRRIDTVFPV